MKRKIEELFVATITYDLPETVELWSQYDTFGQDDHHLIITPKKRLVYSSYDENGTLKYYDYETDKEIQEYSKLSSYSTNSACGRCYSFYGVSGSIEKQYDTLRKYSYFVPFEEYIHDRLGITIHHINPKVANALLKIIPSFYRTFELSFDEDVAMKQLNKHIFLKETKEKIKSL